MLKVANRYNYDIFISYAHLDNQPLVPGERGWVSELHDVLSIRLSMLRGENARIWRDQQLRKNEVFDESIAEACKSTKLFISVVTPRYIRSRYCQRELKEFVNDTTLQVADRSRLFKVLKTPVPIENHPLPMKNLLGYEFFDYDDETHHTREYRMDSQKYKEDYLSRLDDLAQEIRECLDMMENYKDVPLSIPQRETIYLGPTSSDMRHAHDTIRRELHERGHNVVPRQPLTLENRAFQEEVRTEMESASLSVHIVGERYGIIPEDGKKSIIEIQNEIASPHAQLKKLDRIIWIPEDARPTDNRQKQFIENLRSDPDTQCNAELVVGTVEDLKGNILDKIDEIQMRREKGVGRPSKPTSVPPKHEGAAPWVYLITGPYDCGDVSLVEDALWDAGMEVLTLPYTEVQSEAELIKEHQANLKQADICLIYYGESPERWIRKQLCDIRKAAGQRRERPMMTPAIYMGTSEKERQGKFRSNSATVIWPNGSDTSEAVASFVEIIEESRWAS